MMRYRSAQDLSGPNPTAFCGPASFAVGGTVRGTVVSFSSLWQQSAGQIIDIPVPRGRRGGGGGLQSFLPVQNSAAPSQQIVDIPVRSAGLQGFRPGQVSTASASLPRSADEAVEGFFALFHEVKKVRSPAGG